MVFSEDVVINKEKDQRMILSSCAGPYAVIW
jgi:hypothetical protein